MVWQDALSSGPSGPAFDAERERERRLAAQARAGADWALTALIARYQPTVVRYLTRLCGNPAQARSLAERIFQRMERRLHGPHGGDNLRLWLLRASTESGLDALRRPQRAPTPRLGGGGIAGLLTRQSGQPARGATTGGLRPRGVRGGASQQARPLVWANDDLAPATSEAEPHADSAANPASAPADGHLDESLDRLDPRDALRHRLVRVTLAELSYGDAQCLALHLVAGLNQAEVARALGLTNSAARKRIVHGLAQFADRYTQAVQSLGLPVELGFGDAMPRAPMEPEPVAPPEPAPAPIIVAAQAPVSPPDTQSEADEIGEDRVVESPAQVVVAAAEPVDTAERLASAAYPQQRREQHDDGPLLPMPPSDAPASFPETFYVDTGADDPSAQPGLRADVAGAAGGIGAFSILGEMAQADAPRATVAVDDTQPATRATPLFAPTETERPAAPAEAQHAELAEPANPAPVSGGLITRLAADAIIGPIVDALPVSPATPEPGSLPEVMGLIAPRSMPLAYELSSSGASDSAQEASSVTVNWLDDDGLMTPLTFEAFAVPTDAPAPLAESLPVADTPLVYEAVAVPTGTLTPLAAPDDALSYEALGQPVIAPGADLAHETGAALEYELAPTVVIEHHAETLTAAPDLPTPDVPAPEPRPAGGVVTRSLEELWDEAP